MTRRPAISVLAAMLLAGVPASALAQDPEDTTTIHWAMAGYLGTGWYRIDDSRSVFVLRIPPRQIVRESSFDGPDQREIGIEIKYNLTLGLHDFDFDPGIIDDENVGTVNITPGLELEIPVTDRFYLRPFAHLGWGSETSADGDSAWSWFTGIKSRYRLTRDERNVALIGNLYYGGYSEDDGESDEMTGVALGMEGAVPLPGVSFQERPLELDWHWTYTYFSNEPLLERRGLPDTKIDRIIEVGLAISPRGEFFDFWLWRPERIGLSYQWEPGGEFSGIGVNMTSWFRR